MKKIILIIALLANPLISLADTLQTNVQGVTVKNFQCVNGNVTFNVVNKSNKALSYLYINIFDSENDPINKIYVNLNYLSSNSGQEYAASAQCNKLTRVGITVN